ncbi:uncharacterized protein TNCV_3070451 [Trichonephila clavipes]|nr:uncharacterized protein TNCV_3070451 [Trichonephila clavipes]
MATSTNKTAAFANPQVYVETPLHPEKLTVWCALWAGGIIGPSSKTMKATTLQSMELWFQQDGATCHTARSTIDLLKDTFGDRLISRFGPVNWPPRSCDLTPLDYFLWGYVKSLVYADKPQTLDHLEDNIRRVIADIRPQILEKVIENWTSRLDYIRASRGSPMPEIIFKNAFKLRDPPVKSATAFSKNPTRQPFMSQRVRMTFGMRYREVSKDEQIKMWFVSASRCGPATRLVWPAIRPDMDC